MCLHLNPPPSGWCALLRRRAPRRARRGGTYWLPAWQRLPCRGEGYSWGPHSNFSSGYWAQGPTAREARRDTTAFETARAEWSRSAISVRGKGVGAEGDHGTEVWLG